MDVLLTEPPPLLFRPGFLPPPRYPGGARSLFSGFSSPSIRQSDPSSLLLPASSAKGKRILNCQRRREDVQESLSAPEGGTKADHGRRDGGGSAKKSSPSQA